MTERPRRGRLDDEATAAARELRERADHLSHGQSVRTSRGSSLGDAEVVRAIAAFIEVLGRLNRSTGRFTWALVGLAGVTLLATVVSVALLFVQIEDARVAIPVQNALALSGMFFNNANTVAVIKALDEGGPILKEHGGSIADTQLDQYLDGFETVAGVWDARQIRESDLCDGFKHYVDQVFANAEVRGYIAAARHEDPQYWGGLDEIRHAMQASRNPNCR
jgi:hypothetical protein